MNIIDIKKIDIAYELLEIMLLLSIIVIIGITTITILIGNDDCSDDGCVDVIIKKVRLKYLLTMCALQCSVFSFCISSN